MPLADATAIAFSQPLFSVVVAAVIAGELAASYAPELRVLGATLDRAAARLDSDHPGTAIAVANVDASRGSRR